MAILNKLKPDFDTGKIYGGHKDLPEGVYIGLFHGREDPSQDMDDWGFHGPVIGPIEWCQTTYKSHVRFCPVGEHDGVDLVLRDDMVEYKGKFYGDFTVFHHKPNNG